MNDGMYTKSKKIATFIIGIAVLWSSVVFSKNGFEFKTSSDYVWIGWVLAFAATCAEFMFNSTFKKINWSIVGLGLCAYAYSIWTNVLGFHSLRTSGSLIDPINILGAIFMDVFPEVAIAWALGESKLGDAIGNVVRVLQNPEQVTNQTNGVNHDHKPKYVPKHRPVYAPLPPLDEDPEDDDEFPG